MGIKAPGLRWEGGTLTSGLEGGSPGLGSHTGTVHFLAGTGQQQGFKQTLPAPIFLETKRHWRSAGRPAPRPSAVPQAGRRFRTPRAPGGWLGAALRSQGGSSGSTWRPLVQGGETVPGPGNQGSQAPPSSRCGKADDPGTHFSAKLFGFLCLPDPY